MPPTLKKRKIGVSTFNGAAKPTFKAGITAFGRITKSNSALPSSTKDLAIKENALLEFSEQLGGSSKKRAVELLESPQEKEVTIAFQDKSIAIASRAILKPELAEPQLPALPVKPRKKAPLRAKNVETPTKGARSFLEAFALTSSPSRRASSPLPARADTPPTSPASIERPCPTRPSIIELPEELQDLVDLHSAFLTALALHYAHNGSFSPVDLLNLRPSIERAWGKRRITTDDIRLTLGILASGQSEDSSPTYIACPLVLSDFGNGKICVEISESSLEKSQRRQPIDVEKLNVVFFQNLSYLWTVRSSSDIASFLANLYHAPLIPCTSLNKTTPLRVKGQRRLEDLKAGASRAQLANQTPKTALSQKAQTRPKPPSSRSSSLLERIQAKELHQSTLPTGPSPEFIARRNALQRLEEVIPVLEILTSSVSRSNHNEGLENGSPSKTSSFTMPTVVQHLQMSLRNPVSKDEAVRCIELLAEVIAPEWVGVRDIGKLKGVTVKGASGVGREEMGRRITEAMRNGS